MELQRAQNVHIPGLLALLRQVGGVHRDIRPELFREGAQKYDEKALEELLRDPDRPIFVAVRGEQVLGYCFCQRRVYRGDPVMTDRQELYIDDLCVDARARGRGIATALFALVREYARREGCGFLTLNVWNGNDGAMAFYRKVGMAPRSVNMDMALEED